MLRRACLAPDDPARGSITIADVNTLLDRLAAPDADKKAQVRFVCVRVCLCGGLLWQLLWLLLIVCLWSSCCAASAAAVSAAASAAASAACVCCCVQVAVLREGMGRCTARQMKWLVRIVLKEIKVCVLGGGGGEKGGCHVGAGEQGCRAHCVLGDQGGGAGGCGLERGGM